MEQGLSEAYGYKETDGRVLEEVMTTAEACTLWGLGESTLRSAIRYNRFKEDIDYRKSGKVWLITRKAMERVYGNID